MLSAGKKLMQAGGAATGVGMVGMVTGAAMLAFSSAFGAESQSSIALMVATGGAALSIAGVAIVCIGLVVRPSRAVQNGRLYVPVHHRDPYMRPMRQRRQVSAPAQSTPAAEQPVVAGSA
ncbi:hypothetical protein ASE14_01085 [Agromyces sp. Root81]|uniref:hypothetical protein n=1 Tax=Agromyces sp. Root81 TaxID=1736601 RepID=UPI00070099D8|nr:hypothetical protein [Agromyces sp. Root81]KRC62463.1 hypothetical protein ASE14_01085 [Agromyces sp. Root81]